MSKLVTASEFRRMTVGAFAHTNKEALYHSNRGRQFRPTRKEIESQKYKCPYCVSTMKKVRFRPQEHGYTCPRCRWSISQHDIWSPTQHQEPIVREQGDVEEIPTATDPKNELSMDDVLREEVEEELGPFEVAL